MDVIKLLSIGEGIKTDEASGSMSYSLWDTQDRKPDFLTSNLMVILKPSLVIKLQSSAILVKL